jgi:hypothetical protein
LESRHEFEDYEVENYDEDNENYSVYSSLEEISSEAHYDLAFRKKEKGGGFLGLGFFCYG